MAKQITVDELSRDMKIWYGLIICEQAADHAKLRAKQFENDSVIFDNEFASSLAAIEQPAPKKRLMARIAGYMSRN